MGNNIKRFPLPCGSYVKKTVQTQDLAGDVGVLKTLSCQMNSTEGHGWEAKAGCYCNAG